MDSNSQVQPTETEASPQRSGQFFRTALLIAGSALLGGLAVAVFNRKQIETMRQNSTGRTVPFNLPKPEEEI